MRGDLSMCEDFDYDLETGICRNKKDGTSIRSLRREGYMGDAETVFLFQGPDREFEFRTRAEHGLRQAEALFPMPSGTSREERIAIRERRDAWKKEMKILHQEISEVDQPLPMDLGAAEALMRLIQARISRCGKREMSGGRTTVGFKNRAPKAGWRERTPYLKLDYDGTFSVNESGSW